MSTNENKKWVLLAPVALPFLFLALFRLVWLAAGADWSDPSSAALLSIMLGFLSGLILVGVSVNA